jgi:hypothetical protein
MKTRKLFGTIVVILTIWLIGGNLAATILEENLDRKIAEFVRQHPKTSPNQSAIDLQTSIAKLGLSVKRFGDGSNIKSQPDTKAVAEWQAIEPTLDRYLYLDEELAKTEDSFYPIPNKLHNYLNKHHSEIAEIQSFLIDREIPDWGSDSSWIEKNHPEHKDRIIPKYLSYFNIYRFQKLSIANILDRDNLTKSNVSRELMAINNLNLSLQSQHSASAQFYSYNTRDMVDKLVRRLNIIPVEFVSSLTNQEQLAREAIEYYSLAKARINQNPASLIGDKKQEQILSLIFRYHHLWRPATRSIAAHIYRENSQALSSWHDKNICQLSHIPTDAVDRYVIEMYASDKVSNLNRELTTSVGQIKSQLGVGQSIDRVAGEFKLRSQVCPGEQWTAQVKDGMINITFSHSINWVNLGLEEKDNIDDRLTYRINPKNILNTSIKSSQI